MKPLILKGIIQSFDNGGEYRGRIYPADLFIKYLPHQLPVIRILKIKKLFNI